jgi:hypothetical protein
MLPPRRGADDDDAKVTLKELAQRLHREARQAERRERDMLPCPGCHVQGANTLMHECHPGQASPAPPGSREPGSSNLRRRGIHEALRATWIPALAPRAKPGSLGRNDNRDSRRAVCGQPPFAGGVEIAHAGRRAIGTFNPCETRSAAAPVRGSRIPATVRPPSRRRSGAAGSSAETPSCSDAACRH